MKIRLRDSDTPVRVILRSRPFEQVYWRLIEMLIRDNHRAVRREADAGDMAPKMLFTAWYVWHLIMLGGGGKPVRMFASNFRPFYMKCRATA